MLYGLGIIKEAEFDKRTGACLNGSISFQGYFEVRYPARGGESHECFAQLPGTHLTTKNYDNLPTLRKAMVSGSCLLR